MRAVKDCGISSDPEVSARAKHRTFTADEKVQMQDCESAASPIERAAVMRRAHSSLVSNWRKQLALVETPETRGRPLNRDALEAAAQKKRTAAWHAVLFDCSVAPSGNGLNAQPTCEHGGTMRMFTSRATMDCYLKARENRSRVEKDRSSRRHRLHRVARGFTSARKGG